MEKVPMLSQTFSQSNQTDQSRVTFQSHLLSTPWLASELGTSCLPCSMFVMNTVAQDLLATALSLSELLCLWSLFSIGSPHVLWCFSHSQTQHFVTPLHSNWPPLSPLILQVWLWGLCLGCCFVMPLQSTQTLSWWLRSLETSWWGCWRCWSCLSSSPA